MSPLASLAAAAFVVAAAAAPLDRPTTASHKDAQQRDAMVADRRRQRQREAESTEWNRLLRLVRWKYPKPGHSVKQGQRMARKARNRRRSK